MVTHKHFTPLNIGILSVTVAYLLFNFHTLFTLEWVGEWERIAGGAFGLKILIEDITAAVGVIFRFIGSIMAFAALIYYFVRKEIALTKCYFVIRCVLVFEAIYWLGLLASGIGSVLSLFGSTSFIYPSASFYFFYVVGSALPGILESTLVPGVLLIFAHKVSIHKPIRGAIKWGLISITSLVFTYWLLNSGIWIFVIPVKGLIYLTAYPYMMIAFLSTVLGLFALTVYSVCTTKKLFRTEKLQELNFKQIGFIIFGLGLFYLWNYLTWIFFGGNHVWSNWFAWLLGHNMDLWMLSLPLVGLPLLFSKNRTHALLLTFEWVGAIFTGIFLAAYLGGLPTTKVLHSEVYFRFPLIIMGIAYLVLLIVAIIVLVIKEKKWDTM